MAKWIEVPREDGGIDFVNPKAAEIMAEREAEMAAFDPTENALSATQMEQTNARLYQGARHNDYPPLAEQLDMLWHAMEADESKRLEPFYSAIKAVKENNPKPPAPPAFEPGT
jgi:hypothetical protein